MIFQSKSKHGNFYLYKSRMRAIIHINDMKVVIPCGLFFSADSSQYKTPNFEPFRLSNFLLIFYKKNPLNSCDLHSFIIFSNEKRKNIFTAILVVMLSDSKSICHSPQISTDVWTWTSYVNFKYIYLHVKWFNAFLTGW